MTDYEKQYRESRDVCGPPFPELVAFFEHYDRTRAKVLDLGCGQGRDALFIARMGHHVLGVDISKTGISQMLEQAEREELDICGVVADVVEYEPSGDYDVVILDRVLHMLKDNGERLVVLEKASAVTKPGGFVLIADTPKHQRLIRSFFEDHSDAWVKARDKKGYIFVQKLCGTLCVPRPSSEEGSMAYDEGLAQRVREEMGELPGYVEKKMFGGIGFMLHGNMACGVIRADLIVRVGPEQYETALAEPHTRLFDMTGRPMRGWVIVTAQGYEADADLGEWVQRGVDYALSLPVK